MKQLLIFSLLFLLGCGATKLYTVWYKEDTSDYYQNGKKCIQSGITIDENKKILIEYYKNCDSRKIRVLEDRDYPMWGIKRN